MNERLTIAWKCRCGHQWQAYEGECEYEAVARASRAAPDPGEGGLRGERDRARIAFENERRTATAFENERNAAQHREQDRIHDLAWLRAEMRRICESTDPATADEVRRAIGRLSLTEPPSRAALAHAPLSSEIREILRDTAKGVTGACVRERAAAAIVARDLCHRCAGTGMELLDTGPGGPAAWGTCHGCGVPAGRGEKEG